MNVEEWRKAGQFHTLNGRRLFVMDSGVDDPSAADKPNLVILHGYPTSSHDYYRVLPTLAEHHRVIVHDHLGFGLSEKPQDYSYAIQEQTDFALMLWQHLGVESAHVFAHDYGTSLATELLARWNLGFRLVPLHSLTLCNGSVHIEMARLRLIQKLLRNKSVGPLVARLTRQSVFNRNMRQLWHDPSKLLEADLDSMWDLLTRDGGKRVLPNITQYLNDRVLFWNRWVGALQQSQLPLAFIWGAEDPVTGVDVAKVHHAEAPGSRLTILDGVGHYPMIEAPAKWSEALLNSLAPK